MSHYAFNWFALPPLFTAICSLLTGVMLFRLEWSSWVGKALLLVTAAVSLWSGATAVSYLAADAATALLWTRVGYVAVPMFPAAMFLYTSVGLRLYDRQKYFAWLLFVAGLVFVLLAWNTDLLVSGMQKHWWGYYPRYDWVGIVFVGYFAFVVAVIQLQFRAVVQTLPRRSLSYRRVTRSALAIGLVSLGAVDFVAKFGLGLYPFGYVFILASFVLVMIIERHFRVVYMTPAFAAGQILDTLEGAVLVARLDGTLEVGNKAAGELLGYSEDELLALSLSDVCGSGNEWHLLLERMQAGDRVRAEESTWRRKNGAEVHVSISASLLSQDKDPAPVGIVITALDITERKNAEAALKESEEQLRQAQKMEAIGQLAGGIAHDFNNMLTAIIGNSSLALSAIPEEDPNRGLILDIHEVGERAAVLTKQILAFSRRQVLKPETLSLNQVLSDLEPLLRRSIGEDIELRYSLAPDLRFAEIDRNQIGQVVLNLAVNARDAMPSGGMLLVETANADMDEVVSRQHPEIKPGNYVSLIVSDNGCGMDESTRRRLFEPFFTTKPKGKGTGLGLSTVFGIVKQSGGGVYVYSEPGIGSTFKVFVPATRTGAPRGSIGASLARSTTKRDIRQAAERILVVEDEAQVRNLIVRVLSAAGYEVKAAGSAERVEQLVDTTGYRPDILVTDIVLPGGINGRQVADRMCERFPGLPVLFMSGYTRTAVVHDGRLDEGIAFLEKPFTPDVLLRHVREVLETAKL